MKEEMIPIFCKFGGAIRRMITGGAMLGLAMTGLGQDPGPLAIGLSAVDITPDYPVRLNGFGVRWAESEGVTQRIWAKAFAFQDAEKGPLILITTDNLCVPDQITQEIALRLEKTGLKRERLTITATHTHSAPMLKNTCPTIFGVPIPAAHEENIDRYTRDFTDKLEKAALAALQTAMPDKAMMNRLGQIEQGGVFYLAEIGGCEELFEAHERRATTRCFTNFRGGLVDVDAVIEALWAGQIGAAALDVLDLVTRESLQTTLKRLRAV
jgi:hypothetical protein